MICSLNDDPWTRTRVENWPSWSSLSRRKLPVASLESWTLRVGEADNRGSRPERLSVHRPGLHSRARRDNEKTRSSRLSRPKPEEIVVDWKPWLEHWDTWSAI